MNAWAPYVLSFIVPGEPIGTARPRVTRNGTFTPKASRDAQDRVGAAFLDAYPAHRPSIGAAYVRARFYRATAYRRDIDNLVKTVLDGLNGLAYVDDYQVQDLKVKVILKAPRTEARTEVVCYFDDPQEGSPP